MKTPEEKTLYNRQYHLAHREDLLARNKKYREEHGEWLYTQKREQQLARADQFMRFKESIGCFRCHYSEHGAALDFHHIVPKTKRMQVSSANYLRPRGIEERKKCIVICANCHRIETSDERRANPQRWSKRQENS